MLLCVCSCPHGYPCSSYSDTKRAILKMRFHNEQISDFCHSKSIDIVYKAYINHFYLPFCKIRLYKLPRQQYPTISMDSTCKNQKFHNASNNPPKSLVLVSIHYYSYCFIIIMEYHLKKIR
jgi:hypothetical protein